ncbi:MAG: alkaline phosphatase family protein [Sciscionella sp.]
MRNLSPSSVSPQPGLVPRLSHIVVVVEENHSYSDVIGNGAAPYINSLARRGANLTNSHGVAHPSEPNYLALFSGSTQGLTDDSCPHSYTTTNLAGQLAAKGLSFATFSEGLPMTGYTGCASGHYARKHNPAPDFTSVSPASNLSARDFPAPGNALPTVSFLIPNLNNDMHDGSIGTADRWLHRHIQSYAQWCGKHNSALVLTWDEDDNSAQNHIPTIILGAHVRPGKYTEPVSHYNILRTIDQSLGLTPTGLAARTAPITDVFSHAHRH